MASTNEDEKVERPVFAFPFSYFHGEIPASVSINGSRLAGGCDLANSYQDARSIKDTFLALHHGTWDEFPCLDFRIVIRSGQHLENHIPDFASNGRSPDIGSFAFKIDQDPLSI